MNLNQKEIHILQKKLTYKSQSVEFTLKREITSAYDNITIKFS